MKDKVRRKKYTPKVKKAIKLKVPKIPKEKNLKRNSRTGRDNGNGENPGTHEVTLTFKNSILNNLTTLEHLYS